MSPHAWRRVHGHAITAEVISDGQGAWRAKVFLTTNPTVAVTTSRQADTLSAAQAKADALARKTFDHRCDQTCGQWVYDSLPPAAD